MGVSVGIGPTTEGNYAPEEEKAQTVVAADASWSSGWLIGIGLGALVVLAAVAAAVVVALGDSEAASSVSGSSGLTAGPTAFFVESGSPNTPLQLA